MKKVFSLGWVSLVILLSFTSSLAVEQFGILYTATVQGETEPCGCRTPLGGLAKKVTAFNKIRKETTDLLILDAGDLFFSATSANSGKLDQMKETGLFMVTAYNSLGYQVYNVGGNDLLAGVEFIKSAQKRAKFPFVSANIIDEKTQKLYFLPYKFLKIKEKRFAIIGVTSKPIYPTPGLNFLELKEALKRYLPDLKKKADYIIVLAAVNSKDEAIIREVTPAYDFLLIDSSSRYSRNLEYVNGINIARCGYIGKYIGFIKATINQPDLPLEDISKIKVQLGYTTERLQTFSREAGEKTFEEFYSNNPSTLSIIQNLQAREKELISQKASIVNPIDFDLIPLDESVADDPVMRQKLNKHVEYLKSLGFKIESTK